MTNPVIVGRKIHFTSEGGSVVVMSRAAAEKSLADFRTRLPKIVSQSAKADMEAAIASYELGIDRAKANGL